MATSYVYLLLSRETEVDFYVIYARRVGEREILAKVSASEGAR